MSKSIPPTLTIEEAVSLMIGLDYIPSGLTALDMTAAFLEDSEVDMENNPKSSLRSARHDVCLARHQLATSLLTALNLEAENKDSEYLDRAEDKSPSQRFTTESLNHWAQDRFGITLWAPSAPSDETDSELTNATWRDVTIKIYADHRIGYQIKNSPFKQATFQELGLIGKRKLNPNESGMLLIAFSMRGLANMSKKTAVSKLRAILRSIICVSGDPFPLANKVDGWAPAFTLIDDRRNADERAKNNAIHLELDPESLGFEEEDDEAGRLINASRYQKP